MNKPLQVCSAIAIALFAPSVASAADLGYGYDSRVERYEYQGYGGPVADDEEPDVVVERELRPPPPRRYAPVYDEPVEYYYEEPPPPRRIYVRRYHRPYLREFSWYDRPHFAAPWRERHWRTHDAGYYYDR